ncbi:MAG: extracellular solute-binding protein [Thermoflexales bacterium]|nr:extracellular solute-binding protein [Thermoflexales bacterium]
MTQSKGVTRRTFLKGAGAAALGASATALASCQPAAPAAPAATAVPAAAATKAPVVLKGAKVNWLGGPWSFLPELDPVIDTFCNDWAKQNNVTLTFEREATNLNAKIQTAIETGSGANIIQLANPPATFAKSLADVTEVATFLGAEGGGYLPAGPFQCTSAGKWIAVPLGQHNWFINYRQDWLKEEGVDKFPDTWEEALALGKKLKAKGRPFGMTLSDKAGGDGNAAPYLILWAFGAKEFNPDGSLALDSKETIAALEFAIKLHNEAGDPGEVAYDDGANNAGFLAEKISMTANVNTIYLPALKNTPKVAAGMNHALPPKGPAGRFGACTLPWWGVLNHTKGADLDAAKDMIKQFFSMANMSKFYKAGQGYILPVLPKYESADIWPADPKLAIAKEMFKLALPAGYALPNQTKLSGLMQEKVMVGKLFSQACSTGNARAALDGVLKEINDLKLLS